MIHALEITALLRDVAVIVLAGIAATLYRQVVVVKDAQIELLRSRIAHLEATSAPTLLDQTEKMSAAIEDYAAKTAKLENDLSQASAKNESLSVEITAVNESAQSIGAFGGAFESLLVLTEAMDTARASNVLAGRDPDSELGPFKPAFDEIWAIVKTAMHGKKPSFPRLVQLRKEVTNSKAITEGKPEVKLNQHPA